MAFASFKLENLPRRIQLAIIAVLAVGLAAVVYMFFLRTLLAEHSAIQKEIAQLEAAVAQATAVESQLDQFKREVAALDARLDELRRILPEPEGNSRRAPQRAADGEREQPPDRQIRAAAGRVARVSTPTGPSAWKLQGSYNALGVFL